MLTDEQIAAFQRDGFLNAGPVLRDAEIARLSGALDDVIAKGPGGFAADEPRPVLVRDLAAGGYDAGGAPPSEGL